MFWRPAATPLTDQLHEPQDAGPRSGSSGGSARSRREQPHLQLGQRIDVGVAQRDRALQHGRAVEQPLAPGDRAAAARRCGGTRPRSSPSGAPRRRRASARRTGGRRPCRPWPGPSPALSSTRREERPGTVQPGDLARCRPRRAPPRYASSAEPRPYQPGRLMRDWDHAKVHGIARSASIGGASSASAPDRPRAAGRDPRRRSDSSRDRRDLRGRRPRTPGRRGRARDTPHGRSSTARRGARHRPATARRGRSVVLGRSRR